MLAQPASRLLASLALATAALGLALPHPASHALAALPPVVVTGVAVDNSSVKISYNPVAGAKDYRVYDVSDPTVVKYAGMTHLDAGIAYHFVMQPDGVTPVFPYTSTDNFHGTGPQTLTVPGTEIQWNRLDDGASHTLVVQAVDQLGPVPPHNLADYYNNPLNPPADMLGANAGMTPDGNTSINGQGPSSDTPHVIAQSAPLVVQANKALLALPSRPDAVQTFYDTFDSAEGATLQQVGTALPASGKITYTLNAGTARAWDIVTQGLDTDHSMPMVEDGHFMDVLFDGQTPSSIPAGWCGLYKLCPHDQYSNLSLSPHTTADLSGGKLLHLTMEVDAHMVDTNRWLSWQLAPATDPITNFHSDNYVTDGFQRNANTLPVNSTDKALWVQLMNSNCDALLLEGRKSPTNPAPITNQFIGLFTPGPTGYPICHRTVHWGDAGAALDDRDRWDLFLTTTHLALFEDGKMLIQADIPDGGLPFTAAKIYFTHYVYATGPFSEPLVLKSSAPWETYWLNYFPHSDERHWDNMGFEVLPASAVPSDWSTLSSLIHMPASATPAAR